MIGKKFKIRNALIAEKLENVDIKNLYNLCVVILTTGFFDTLIRDYAESNSTHFGTRLLVTSFNKFHIVILMLFVLNIFASACYLCFNFWAKFRILLNPKTLNFWDKSWLLLLISYYIFSFYFTQKIIKFFGFKHCSALVVSMEQVRLLMKQYAFVRTNAPKVLQNGQNVVLNFQKYIYFLFAPTLIYREEYPRTTHIRWRVVLNNLLAFLFILWNLSLFTDVLVVPHFRNICIEKIPVSQIIKLILGSNFPGIMFQLFVFYLILHSTQIIFAELLRFGDRMFYGNWWALTSQKKFFQKWNVLVQDWLYFYVYKDVRNLTKNNFLPKILVFTLSAVVHEWIIINGLNLFFPIMSALFLYAMVMLMMASPFIAFGNNFVVLCSFAFTYSLAINLYGLEIAARQNCPLSENHPYLDFYKLRFITCDCLEYV